jgi:hypothetical protein
VLSIYRWFCWAACTRLHKATKLSSWSAQTSVVVRGSSNSTINFFSVHCLAFAFVGASLRNTLAEVQPGFSSWSAQTSVVVMGASKAITTSCRSGGSLEITGPCLAKNMRRALFLVRNFCCKLLPCSTKATRSSRAYDP